MSVLAMCACTQGEPDFVSAEIDGKRVEFRENASAVVSGIQGRMETLTFSASAGGGDASSSFEVDLELPGGQLATTRYSGRQLRLSAPRPGFKLDDALTAQYTRAGAAASYINDTSDDGPAGDFAVELTSLRDGQVQGTFSGGLDDANGHIVQVRDGRFSLQYEYRARTGW